MKDVDGFTLVDQVKSCIEILMNMKMEGPTGDQDEYEDYEEEEGCTRYEITDEDFLHQNQTIDRKSDLLNKPVKLNQGQVKKDP
jgi:hypothetical protein